MSYFKKEDHLVLLFLKPSVSFFQFFILNPGYSGIAFKTQQ